jgi:hypothetical protein
MAGKQVIVNHFDAGFAKTVQRLQIIDKECQMRLPRCSKLVVDPARDSSTEGPCHAPPSSARLSCSSSRLTSTVIRSTHLSIGRTLGIAAARSAVSCMPLLGGTPLTLRQTTDGTILST